MNKIMPLAVFLCGINVEEPIDRWVGCRPRKLDGLSLSTHTKADTIAWRKAFGGIRIPRGVHRFATRAETDEWLWRMITRLNLK